MGFHEHKITAFTHKITDLPDQPTLSPQELKARFDSSPEELRKAHNAACDEGERLSARVEGIVTETFGDTIDREMLSHELAAELDAKAEQTALDAAVDTLKAADTAETTAREALAKTVAQKCEIFLGTYTGDGQDTRIIPLDFTPKALFIIAQNGAVQAEKGRVYGGMAFPDVPCVHSVEDSSKTAIEISGNGFIVGNGQVASMHNDWIYTNRQDVIYLYVAVK